MKWLTAGIAALAMAAASSAEDWTMYLHDPAHTSFNSAESVLDPTNVGSLAPAWILSLKAPVASGVTVVDGVLFVGDWDGYFHAIRADDGNVLWSQFVGKAPPPADRNCQSSIGVSSQATIAGDVVYVGGGDSALYALDRGTGKQLWRVRLAEPRSGSYIWSSLTQVDGSLYLGIASLGDCPLVRGAMVRVDLDTPQHPVFKYMVAQDEVGSGIWSTPAFDTETNTILLTTGNGPQDPDQGGYGSGIVSLDAATLEVKSHFFIPSDHLEGDIEFGSSPTLFQKADGTRMVGAAGKDGFLYGLSLDTLEPQWITRIAIPGDCPECGEGSISTPAFDGALLYAGAGATDPESSTLGSVYAIDPSTGAVVWAQDLIGTVIAPVTIANTVLYVSTGDGVLAFNAYTGEQLWSDGSWGPLVSQPVVVDGTLYATYLKGEIVAWRLPGGSTPPRERSRWQPSK